MLHHLFGATFQVAILVNQVDGNKEMTKMDQPLPYPVRLEVCILVSVLLYLPGAGITMPP